MLLVSMCGMSQQTGKATHYAKYMHNHKTASGSRLNNYGYECAHKKHPFGTMLRVRNLNNNKEVVVKVVDRGPYAKGKIIDLTWQAAKDLGMIGHGVAPVIITVEGKDDTSSTTDGGSDITPLNQWTAGATTTIEAINTFGGLDKCFEAEEIPDNVWQRMQGKTYKENPYIKRDDLRHIRVLHWDYDNKIHIGEMICSEKIADTLVKIFRQLYDAKYPIQRMVLPDVYDADDEKQMRDNNTSCFCYRAIAGTAKLSKHARGLAVDINTLYNPYYKDRTDGTRFIQPAIAAEYCNRDKTFPYKIDTTDLCYQLFTSNGFEWGGSWTSCKDFQHFELKE